MRSRFFSLPTLFRSVLIVLVGAGFGMAVAENRDEPRREEPPSVRLRDLKMNSNAPQDPDARRLQTFLEDRKPASEPTPPPSPQTVSPNGGLPGESPEK